MKVKDICTRTVKTCGPETNLATVGWTLWENDCGIVPVVDERGKVLGVITDRDICIAAATKSRAASDIRVNEVVTRHATCARLDDDVQVVLKAMRNERIRRLPVVNPEGLLEGIVSLNDVVLAAKPGKAARPGDVTAEDVLQTLKTLCTHRAAAVEKVPGTRPLAIVRV